ncbi:MAG TPA: 50S ribosomal protein L25 [Acidimicrobiales bacterium]|nr:50S ribosomal protein L25 [Acidimicrobiales bacterium]
MAEITLVAEPGRATGSAASRRLRTAGRVPAVVYGHGADPASVSVDGRELRIALSGSSGVNQLLSLDVAGTRHLALARVLQRHPVRGTVTHVDFQVVSRDEVVSAEVPVTIVGEARAVEQERGVVEHVLASLTIKAKPGSIPEVIEVDVTDLRIGDTIRVAQLPLPAGVTTDVDPEEAVVVAAGSSVTTEVVEEEEAEAEAAAGQGGAGETGGPAGEG